jgi:hypothetical protein
MTRTKHRTHVYLPLDSRRTTWSRHGRLNRDARFDRNWHLYCETCRSLTRDGLEPQVKLELPNTYQMFAEALQGYGAAPLDAQVTIEAQGTIAKRKQASGHRGLALPPKLTLEQIRRQAAAGPDGNHEYWAEMERLVTGIEIPEVKEPANIGRLAA